MNTNPQQQQQQQQQKSQYLSVYHIFGEYTVSIFRELTLLIRVHYQHLNTIRSLTLLWRNTTSGERDVELTVSENRSREVHTKFGKKSDPVTCLLS